eukprot:TRINITY_DN92765_c0_g1_i1.p1 TRINITY_DN92765_c0_g1~~TRINITY_DN92765_c0_g1_i1.p1  ORF type:complete len:480 (-),score=126.00 TRINITY_DN92765_c0_g1_i1:232-1671(-)
MDALASTAFLAPSSYVHVADSTTSRLPARQGAAAQLSDVGAAVQAGTLQPALLVSAVAAGAAVALVRKGAFQKRPMARAARTSRRSSMEGATRVAPMYRELRCRKTGEAVCLEEISDGFEPLNSAFIQSWTQAALAQPGSSVVTAAVVDCGSGSTRSIQISEEMDFFGRPSKIQRQKAEWRGEALAEALKDEAKTEDLLDLLEEKIPDGPVLLGATAGLRHALRMGDVSESDLEKFSVSLEERLGSRASFRVLSGEDEARAEWVATRHVLGKAKADWNCDGLLSGGGMSCQIAVGKPRLEDADAADLFSIAHDMLAPGGLVDLAGQERMGGKQMVAGLSVLEVQLNADMAAMPRDVRGNFALIEWAGNFIGSTPTQRDIYMGVTAAKEALVTRDLLLEKLEAHLEEMRPKELHEMVPRAHAVALVYGTVLRALLKKVFHESATFRCVDGVNWATGHYLLSKKNVLPAEVGKEVVLQVVR